MATTLDGENKSGDARLPVEVIQRVVKQQRITDTVAQDSSAKTVSAEATLSGSRKKLFIRVEDVARVQSQLDGIWNDAPENAPYVDNDGDPAWGPVVLCDRITWKDFDQWLDVFEGDVRRWIFEPLPHDDECGRMLLYSVPSRPHGKTAGKILTIINKNFKL